MEIEPTEADLNVKCSDYWSCLTVGPNEHNSSYPWLWLHRHSYEPRLETHHIGPLFKTLWGREIAENPPSVDYNEIMNSEASHGAVGKWTKNLVLPLSSSTN
jgi:hypothetical protein